MQIVFTTTERKRMCRKITSKVAVMRNVKPLNISKNTITILKDQRKVTFE